MAQGREAEEGAKGQASKKDEVPAAGAETEKQPEVKEKEAKEKGNRGASYGGGGGCTSIAKEGPSKKRLEAASEIWRRTEVMLTHYDEDERAAWWEEMEQMRNSKVAEVQGRSLGDDGSEEERKRAEYVWANFRCAEELMKWEGLPVERYLSAYEKGEEDKAGEEEEEEGGEEEKEARGDWRYSDERQDWTWQDKQEDNWQQMPVPDDEEEGQEDEYWPADGAPEGDQECWFVEGPGEQEDEQEEEEEEVAAEAAKEGEAEEEEPWRESAERGGSAEEGAGGEEWGAGEGEEEPYDQESYEEWGEWDEYDDEQ